MSKITLSSFMYNRFNELNDWIGDNIIFGLVDNSKWQSDDEIITIEVIKSVEHLEEWEEQPELFGEELKGFRYSYHGIITLKNDVLGNQMLHFDPANMSDFFFKYMTLRNLYVPTFKLQKEIDRMVKGTVAVKMRDDSIILNYLINTINH